MDVSIKNNRQTDSLIQPYQENLAKEMNEVLVIAAEEFPIEKGKAQTKLGNLVADLSHLAGINLYNTKNSQNIFMCLLNIGGLRTSLPKGEITRGKIFELMPFENELVVVTISDEKLDELFNYLGKYPQPISGFFGVSYGEKDYKLFIDTEADFDRDSTTITHEGYKILTTDYLANGGDDMSFFLNPIAYETVGIKLRDAIIQYCIQENTNGKQLVGKLDGRISFE